MAKFVTSGDSKDCVNYIQGWQRTSLLHPGMVEIMLKMEEIKSVTSGDVCDQVC